jgi:hypothetical protein
MSSEKLFSPYSYAVGDGELGFVIKNNPTGWETHTQPTLEECQSVTPEGWEVYYHPAGFYRARKK